MKTVIVKNKLTGGVEYATYMPNQKGNLQYNVDGQFYTDKAFDKTFTIVDSDITATYANFPGLIKKALEFELFQVVDRREDPQVPGVYMLQIKFTDGQYGLCIWDGNNKVFLEEPSSYEDYGTSAEEMERQAGFEHLNS